MVRILHTADLHLDSPFSLKDRMGASARRTMLRSTFTSATLFARMEHIDIFLIPGDVFDTQFATRDTLLMMKEEFAKCPETRFVISPGNHDPYTADSPWAKTQFPDNVYIFTSEKLSYFSFPELNTVVYGFAWNSDTLPGSPLDQGVELDRTKLNILSVHADQQGKQDKYFQFTEKQFSDLGFDYIALGHIHNTTDEIKCINGTYYAYSGCLEGRSFDECGIKSAIIGELDKNAGVHRFSRRSFTQRHFEIEEVDVSGRSTAYEIISAVNEASALRCFDPNASVRFILKGEVSPSLIISDSVISEAVSGPGYVEIKDETVPSFGADALLSDPGIRGQFYRTMLPLLESEDEAERKKAEAALRIGLHALDTSKS